MAHRKAEGTLSFGDYSFCKIPDGQPNEGMVMIYGVTGSVLHLENHTTSIRLSAYYTPVTSKPAAGSIAASISGDEYSYNGTDLVVGDPCENQSTTITLVVHHIFTPDSGGVVQEVWEAIPKTVDCPIENMCPIPE